MTIRPTVLSVFLPAFLACRREAPPAPPPVAPTATSASVAARADAPVAAPASDADMRAVAQSTNAFGLELFRSVRTNAGNVAVSPVSVSVALAMADAGARGPTAAQIEHTLRLDANGLDAARGRSALGALVRGWSGDGHGVTLRAANAVWTELSAPLERGYLDTMHSVFGAEARALDFAHSAEGSRATINTWVDAQTEHKIPTLLAPGTVGESTRAVLTNAVYFRGLWTAAFDARATQPGPFALADHTNATVPMMHRSGAYRMASANDVAVLELSYQNSPIAMDVILPVARDGLDAVENSLTPERFAGWLTALQAQPEIVVTLPRFHVNAPSRLAQNLIAMGMPLAFSDSADFTGMSSRGGLGISNVIHQVTVDVDEQGTVAAAATAVVVTDMASTLPTTFTADHPFLYAIRDTQTGALLFLGRVADPRG